MTTSAFAAHVVDGIGRPLAGTGSSVAVYVPDDALRDLQNPLPGASSFDAMVDLGAEEMPSLDNGSPGAAYAYRVEERRLKTYPRDWADGAPSPGLFVVSTVVRARSLDVASFDAHWRDHHAPLALRHHVGMWDYRQGVVIEALTPEAPRVDGIARLGFPSERAFEQGLFGSKEGRRALGHDMARFCDGERTEVALLREVVLR